MGGGDLVSTYAFSVVYFIRICNFTSSFLLTFQNSKKSWHPNTMKNQERVWKAEQAAAEEKKRILELQRERAEERDRAELNEMARRNAGSSGDDRLNWMYEVCVYLSVCTNGPSFLMISIPSGSIVVQTK